MTKEWVKTYFTLLGLRQQSFLYDGLTSTQITRVKRDLLRLINYLMYPLFISVSIAFFFGIFGTVRILLNYRKTTKRLYRGERKCGDGRRKISSMLRDSLKFPGYHVAHISNGMLLHTFVLAIVSYCVAFFVFTIMVGHTAWIIAILERWSYAVACVAVYWTQRCLVKHVFLQQQGKVLAFNNRRVLFLFR